MGTRLGVELPQAGIYEYARGAALEMSGLMDMGQGFAQLASKIDEVKAVGDLSSATGGLSQMNTDIWKDIDADGQVDGLVERWNDEVNARLPDYIPANISQKARPVVDQLIRETKQQGIIEAHRRMQLATLDQSRKAWANQLERAKHHGNVDESARLVEDGRDVFLNEQEAKQVKRELQKDAQWAPWQKAIEEKPLELLDLLKSEDKSLPKDPDLRRDLEQQVSQRVHDLQGAYGNTLLQNRRILGDIPMQGLEKAEKFGFVSSDQRLRYEEANRQAKENKQKQLPAPKLDPAFACNLRVQIDEMDDDSFSQGLVAVELATSGADAQEFDKIATRFDMMKSIPKSVRQSFSQEIRGLYHDGSLGGLKHPETFKRWSKLQDAVMSQLQDSSEASLNAATQLLNQEKQKYTSWVTSTAMKNKLNQQSKQNTK